MDLEFEKKQEEISKTNKKHLNTFEKWLKEQGLSIKTINNHVSNVEFYINDFLCYYDAQEMVNGCYQIRSFLGDWFIRKAMWSSCAYIKSNAASIKKFYACMLEGGMIEEKDYTDLCETIKEEMPDWLETMKSNDDLCEDDF